MDHAVALVQAYLHANGYFTVAEHPVLERLEAGGYQTATDIDLMGLRLPRAGGVVPASAAGRPEDAAFDPDPDLAIPTDRTDLVIAEVKEGKAILNRGGFGPEVLRAVLLRFGASGTDELDRVVARLGDRGEARLGSGTSVRIFAFGSVVDPKEVRGFRAVSLARVTSFLESYLEQNWQMLRHAQIRHPALGFLALQEQIRRVRDATTPPPASSARNS